jgi:hypothetical protein
MNNDIPVAIVKSLHACGKDEYWLQDKIYENPSVLGLGDLVSVSKEKIQSSGGRLDLLLKDPDDDSMFEVEVMLGDTDESHIIRTIEYWEIERRRWPKRSHTAVLVAEGITTRFFNVVQLLSQAVPIIGIRVSLIEVEGKLGLHFTKIIDSYEEPEIEGDSTHANETTWSKEYPDTLDFAKKYAAFVSTLLDDVTLRFLPNYLAVTISGLDRIWMQPRKNARSSVEYRLAETEIDAIASELDAAGISARRKSSGLALTADKDSLSTHPKEHQRLVLALYAKDLKKKI